MPLNSLAVCGEGLFVGKRSSTGNMCAQHDSGSMDVDGNFVLGFAKKVCAASVSSREGLA